MLKKSRGFLLGFITGGLLGFVAEFVWNARVGSRADIVFEEVARQVNLEHARRIHIEDAPQEPEPR